MHKSYIAISIWSFTGAPSYTYSFSGDRLLSLHMPFFSFSRRMSHRLKTNAEKRGHRTAFLFHSFFIETVPHRHYFHCSKGVKKCR